jgi:CubicO group peptidase (beta-lactamase class C family)
MKIYNCTYYWDADNTSLMNAFLPGSCPDTIATDSGEFLANYLTAEETFYDMQKNFSSPADGSSGTPFNYSNIGAALAAYAIETRTGTLFDELRELNVFNPRGMTNTHRHFLQFDDASQIWHLFISVDTQNTQSAIRLPVQLLGQ